VIGTYSHTGWPKTEIECTTYEEVTLSASPQGLDAAKIALADYVFLRVLDGPIRVTIHPAGVPSTTFGFRMWEGDNAVLTQKEASTLQAVLATAAAGTLQAAYYKNT
jgi:hypothetical protein